MTAMVDMENNAPLHLQCLVNHRDLPDLAAQDDRSDQAYLLILVVPYHPSDLNIQYKQRN